jgi:hypothetical protein
LPDGDLRARLLALARRVGVPDTGVFVVDQSRKSRTANAAVTGLGRTRRILLFDTLLDQFTAEEIEAVLAHELAHQLHGDIRRGLLVQGALTLVTFWIADRALRWGAGWLGLAGPADIAGVPLFGLILVLVSPPRCPSPTAGRAGSSGRPTGSRSRPSRIRAPSSGPWSDWPRSTGPSASPIASRSSSSIPTPRSSAGSPTRDNFSMD